MRNEEGFFGKEFLKRSLLITNQIILLLVSAREHQVDSKQISIFI